MIAYAISTYHHYNVVSSNPAQVIQQYVIKFVSDLRQVGGFLQFFTPLKTDRHDITEILLKVSLNTINQTYDITVIQVVEAVYNVSFPASDLYTPSRHDFAMITFCSLSKFSMSQYVDNKIKRFLRYFDRPDVVTASLL